MEAYIEPGAGTKIHEPTWKDHFRTLLATKTVFSKFMHSIKIYMPYGFDLQTSKSGKTPYPFKIFTQKEMDTYLVGNNLPKSRKGVAPTAFFMVLGAERFENKTRLFLQMTFPATINSATITKESGFMYRWNKKRTTITRFLGTQKPEVVEQQAQTLLKECNRFYFMYHVPKEKKQKKNSAAPRF